MSSPLVQTLTSTFVRVRLTNSHLFPPSQLRHHPQSYLQRLANSTTDGPPDEIRDVHLFEPSSKPEADLGSFKQIVRFQSAYLPGYNMAVASSMRNGPVRGFHKVFENVGRTGNSVMIIHVRSNAPIPKDRHLTDLQRVPKTTRSHTAILRRSNHSFGRVPRRLRTPRRLRPHSPKSRLARPKANLDGSPRASLSRSKEESTTLYSIGPKRLGTT
jgi:hypothetical protein